MQLFGSVSEQISPGTETVSFIKQIIHGKNKHFTRDCAFIPLCHSHLARTPWSRIVCFTQCHFLKTVGMGEIQDVGNNSSVQAEAATLAHGGHDRPHREGSPPTRDRSKRPVCWISVIGQPCKLSHLLKLGRFKAHHDPHGLCQNADVQDPTHLASDNRCSTPNSHP